MAQSKVPKFGAWQGGENENYTAYFDNARNKKTNGPMINPNDPQESPEMFTRNGGPASQPSRATDPKAKQSQAPQFGAWDNGEVGYTAYFENKRKTKNGQPSVPANEPQMNRDMHPQAQPQPAKLEPQQAPKQEARSKVPQFGAWDGEGEVAYTESFDNVRKNNKNGRTVTPEPSGPPPAKEGRSKVPQFGAWEEGDNGAYTAYFENARKTKNVGPVLDNIDPQLNRDVNNRARHPTAGGTKNKIDDQHQLRNASRGSNSSVATSDSAMRHGRQHAGGRSPIHQKAGKLQQKPPASQGSQTPDRGAAIPAWGIWNTDPSQAEGFTGAFTRAKEERNTPLHSNAPSRHNQPQSSQDKKKGCCFGWF